MSNKKRRRTKAQARAAQHERAFRLIKRSMIGRGLLWLGAYLLIDVNVNFTSLFGDIPTHSRYGVSALACLFALTGLRLYVVGMRQYHANEGDWRVYILDAGLFSTPLLAILLTFPGTLNYSISVLLAIVFSLFIDRWYLVPTGRSPMDVS